MKEKEITVSLFQSKSRVNTIRSVVQSYKISLTEKETIFEYA